MTQPHAATTGDALRTPTAEPGTQAQDATGADDRDLTLSGLYEDFTRINHALVPATAEHRRDLLTERAELWRHAARLAETEGVALYAVACDLAADADRRAAAEVRTGLRALAN